MIDDEFDRAMQRYLPASPVSRTQIDRVLGAVMADLPDIASPSRWIALAALAALCGTIAGARLQIQPPLQQVADAVVTSSFASLRP